MSIKAQVTHASRKSRPVAHPAALINLKLWKSVPCTEASVHGLQLACKAGKRKCINCDLSSYLMSTSGVGSAECGPMQRAEICWAGCRQLSPSVPSNWRGRAEPSAARRPFQDRRPMPCTTARHATITGSWIPGIRMLAAPLLAQHRSLCERMPALHHSAGLDCWGACIGNSSCIGLLAKPARRHGHESRAAQTAFMKAHPRLTRPT